MNRYITHIDNHHAGDVHLYGGKTSMQMKMRKVFGDLFLGGFGLTVYANELSDEELRKALTAVTNEYGENTLFAVRSSATVEDGVKTAFAGKFMSLLETRAENLEDAVRQVQQSVTNENVIAYCKKNNIDPAQIKMAILIMPMVGSKDKALSGAIFTRDHESGQSDIYISCSMGYGDAAMHGIVNSEVAVCRRDGMILRRKPRAAGAEYLLSEELILRLSQSACDVETAMRDLSPEILYVDIEYVVTESGDIFFVQSRPETTSCSDPGAFKTVCENTGYNAIIDGTGYAASLGVASGKAVYCNSVEEAENLENNSILLVRETTNHWEPAMLRCAAVVTAYGDPNGHTALTTREIKIPSITGIGVDAMNELRKYTGKNITVDATARIVYEGTADEKHLMQTSNLPDYRSPDFYTEDELFEIANSANMTYIDENGFRWLKKPNQALSGFLCELSRQSCRYIAEILGLSPPMDQVSEGIYMVSFADEYKCIERLHIFTDSELSGILLQWNDALSKLIYLSENFKADFAAEKLEDWIRHYIRFVAFMTKAYSQHLVHSYRFIKALDNRNLPKQYNHRILHSVPPGTPLTWAQKEKKNYISLLKKEPFPTEEELINCAKRYRFIPQNCIEFDAKLPVNELKCKIEVDRQHIPVFFPPEQEEYFVNDPEFCLIHKNMWDINNLRESSHHIKNYCQWLIMEKCNIDRIKMAFDEIKNAD